MFKINNALLIVFIFSLFSGFAKADSVFMYPRTRFNINQVLFSGEKSKSFAESGSAVGAGVKIQSSNKVLAPHFGFNLVTLKDQQTFNDNNSEVTTSFNYYSASADLGLQLFILERQKTGLNIYLTAAGIIGYNFVALSKNIPLNSIPYSDKSFSAGYTAGIGTEFIMSSVGKKKWSLYIEVQYKDESATLFKQKFDLGGLVVSTGFGW